MNGDVTRAVQVQLHHHALREIADGGLEGGLHGEGGVAHDFRHMLVALAQGVEEMGGRGACVIFGDQGLATAGIARHAGQCRGVFGRQDPGIAQGPDQRDRAGGVAADIGHARGTRDGLALSWQFGHPVGPAGRDPMRGGGVDDARVARKRHRLARGVIGQAEDGDVGLREGLGAGVGVLAAGRIDRDEVHIRAPIQPLADLQAGGAGLAVDEYLGHHGRRLLCQ